jgi:hypothetical protein
MFFNKSCNIANISPTLHEIIQFETWYLFAINNYSILIPKLHDEDVNTNATQKKIITNNYQYTTPYPEGSTSCITLLR